MAKKRHHQEKSHHTEHKTHHVEHHQTHHVQHHDVGHPVHHKEHHQPTPVTINMPAPKETGSNSILLENFVSLQRVMTNLAVKLDDLSSNLSKLLELFEISAKALAEKDFDVEKDNKEILDKLNGLVDQNKILARGMALMHERIPREPQYSAPPQQLYPQQTPQPYTSNSGVIRDMSTENASQQFQPSMMQDAEPSTQPSPQRPPFESPI